ncbi:hypothetical protein ACKKBG_A03085 [Auxenochlorella protothecoides x Auxenochlorella symbiontica]|uniref:Cwf15/Cwc15 cell cycle control protein n=1 Tax=Auxenochlorella protothecoides TaxID=3075 RepID=A0A1D2A4Z9_AUXPR
MTTAHRPTWAPAKGGEEQGGMRIFAPSKQQSVKDLPSQTRLKFRQDGQSKAEELSQKDLRAELEEKERAHYLKNKIHTFEEEREDDLRLLQSASHAREEPPRTLIPKAADADDEDDSDAAGSSDDDDDDEDDEAELLAELARIKAERAEEAARKAAAEAAAAESVNQAELLRGNPLLKEKLQAAAGGDASFAIKRQWDDDVVFRNQTRGEPKAQKRFINDTIRNDFHKRFLEKYVR